LSSLRLIKMLQDGTANAKSEVRSDGSRGTKLIFSVALGIPFLLSLRMLVSTQSAMLSPPTARPDATTPTQPFVVVMYFNGECCEHGNRHIINPGDSLESVQQAGLLLVRDRIPQAKSVDLYDEWGLLRTIDGLRSESNVWVVVENALFIWPSVQVGHIYRPSGVPPADPKRPVEIETLSLSPRVYHVRNFLSDTEMADLISSAEAKLQRSHTGIGKEEFNDDRTSRTAWDTSSQNSVRIQHRGFDLLRIPYNVELADAIQIIRYQEGQTYVGHTDYFAEGYSDRFPDRGGTNRFATIFIYLSDVAVGGHTVFPQSRSHAKNMTARHAFSRAAVGNNDDESEVCDQPVGHAKCVKWRATGNCDPAGPRIPSRDQDCSERIPNGESGYCECGNGRRVLRVNCEHSPFLCSNACQGFLSDGTIQTGSTFDKFVRECDSGDGLVVKPSKGDALLFYSQTPIGKLDPTSYHGGCPVLEGQKWAANVWVWNRKRPFFDKTKTGAGSAVKVTFANSRAAVVDLYWQNGKELQQYSSISPGMKWTVDTHAGHVWVAKVADMEVKRWIMSAAKTAIGIS